MGKITQLQKTESLVNPLTGEVFDAVTTYSRPSGYVHYPYMTQKDLLLWFLSTDTPKDRVKAYVIKHASSSENIVAASIEDIAEATNIAPSTAYRTLIELAAADLIKQVSNSIWMINPNHYFNGRKGIRQKLIEQYEKIKPRKRKKNDGEDARKDAGVAYEQ